MNLAKKLNAQSLRVVGDPSLSITRRCDRSRALRDRRGRFSSCATDDVEVLLVGEVPEWETISYVRDASEQGRHKAPDPARS